MAAAQRDLVVAAADRHVVGAVARPHRVVAVAQADGVIAVAHVDIVAAVAAPDRIASVTALHGVVAVAHRHDVVAIAEGDVVGAGAVSGVERVVAVADGDRVVAGADAHDVVAVAERHLVVAVAEVGLVVAIADRRVAQETILVHNVVAVAQDQVIVARTHVDGDIAVSARHGVVAVAQVQLGVRTRPAVHRERIVRAVAHHALLTVAGQDDLIDMVRHPEEFERGPHQCVGPADRLVDRDALVIDDERIVRSAAHQPLRPAGRLVDVRDVALAVILDDGMAGRIGIAGADAGAVREERVGPMRAVDLAPLVANKHAARRVVRRGPVAGPVLDSGVPATVALVGRFDPVAARILRDAVDRPIARRVDHDGAEAGDRGPLAGEDTEDALVVQPNRLGPLVLGDAVEIEQRVDRVLTGGKHACHTRLPRITPAWKSRSEVETVRPCESIISYCHKFLHIDVNRGGQTRPVKHTVRPAG